MWRPLLVDCSTPSHMGCLSEFSSNRLWYSYYIHFDPTIYPTIYTLSYYIHFETKFAPPEYILRVPLFTRRFLIGLRSLGVPSPPAHSPCARLYGSTFYKILFLRTLQHNPPASPQNNPQPPLFHPPD